ncbi:hypothetical protein F5B21DRAFT_528189 [Xylaria acuta]|nr:hypothetical protein F5B21DRAFT_528189 [Xylaria acuta]
MDVKRAPTELIEPSGIHQISLDLMLCICDYLSIPDIYHFSRSSRSLRVSLERYLYIRAAKLHKIDKWEALNFVNYGIDHDWNSNSLRLAIEACERIWPCLLNGLDTRTRTRPPLFAAIENNRSDIVSLLEENLADLNIRHGNESNWDERFKFIIGQTMAADCDSALEIAIRHENLELTERFLANPRVSVRLLALCEALYRGWKPGVAAVLACGRLEQAQVIEVLTRALFNFTSRHPPGWIEYLVSIGADAHWSLPPCYDDFKWDCGLHPRGWDYRLHSHGCCVPYCRTVLSCLLTYGDLDNVHKLLNIVQFGEEYMIYILRQCVRGDRLLEITKIVLEKTNSNATTWAEAYAAAVRVNSNPLCQNEHTIRFLLDYCPKLLQSGAKFDVNNLLKDSGATLLEHALLAMNEQPRHD